MPAILDATGKNFIEQGVMPVDLKVVCLWSAFGLVLTFLTVASSFGAEVGQALAIIG